MGCLCVYSAIFIFVILHSKKQSIDTTERQRSVLSILYIGNILLFKIYLNHNTAEHTNIKNNFTVKPQIV